MKSKYFLGLVLAGGAMAMVAGCGSSTDTTKPAGGGGDTSGGPGATTTSTTTTTTSTTTTTTSTSVSATSSGTGGATQGTSFDNALPILADDPAGPQMGTIADPTADKVFYSFTGKKGDAIQVGTAAKPAPGMGDPFDQTYLDLVVTLYDSTKTAIAEDDDPWPRFTNDPILYSILPADGTYYIMVDECNEEFPGMCAPAGAIVNNDYQIALATVPKLPIPVPQVEKAEPNDTIGAATMSSFSMAGQTDFVQTLVYGTLGTAADTDVFSFTIPMGTHLEDPKGRPRADFYFQPSGALNGDGSTASPGNIWVTDSMGVILSQVDDTVYDQGDDATNNPLAMSVPVKEGSQYFLFVQHNAKAPGANDFDFYFGLAQVGNYFFTAPKEAADMTNGVFGGAETIATYDPQDMSNQFYFGVDGDISQPQGMVNDTDFYAVTVPAGVTALLSLNCVGQRAGSAVRGLAYTLTDQNGKDLGVDLVEDGQSDVTFNPDGMSPLTLPVGTTTVLLSVTVTSSMMAPGGLAPMIADTSYVCQGVLGSPSP